MLTEGDRIQLAPILDKIHASRAALADAKQTAADAQRRVDDLKRSSTLWDRWFNRDSDIGRAYRNARKAHTDAKATAAKWQKQAAAHEVRFDRRLKPMMPRLDPNYVAITVAVEKYAHAVHECRAMRAPINALVATARTAIRTGRDAEAAAFRYRDHLAQAQKAVRAVKHAVDEANSAAGWAGIQGPRPRWNDAPLESLPTSADSVKALRRLTKEMHRLRALPSRLDGVRTDLIQMQARVGRDQRRALTRTREQLVKESAP